MLPWHWSQVPGHHWRWARPSRHHQSPYKTLLSPGAQRRAQGAARGARGRVLDLCAAQGAKTSFGGGTAQCQRSSFRPGTSLKIWSQPGSPISVTRQSPGHLKGMFHFILTRCGGRPAPARYVPPGQRMVKDGLQRTGLCAPTSRRFSRRRDNGPGAITTSHHTPSPWEEMGNKWCTR